MQIHQQKYPITSLLSDTVDEERSQPENSNIKTVILLFPGRVVLYRGFRQAAPREVRHITVAEFRAVAEELQPTYGNVVITRLRRQSKDGVIFIKRRPNDIRDLGGICSDKCFTIRDSISFCMIFIMLSSNKRSFGIFFRRLRCYA